MPMQRDAVNLPARLRAGAAPLLALVLAACGAGGLLQSRDKPEPAVNRPVSADADAARQYLDALLELSGANPSRQAEIVQGAKLSAENAPTTLNRLRYALMLAIPGHPATDAVAARRQLSDLLARPELLLPAERALAAVHLAQVEDRLVLAAENRRLQQESTSRDRDRSAAVSRRLQAEIDENARLRRALDEAQRKLEAVTQVERSITERSGQPPKP
jgi:hypothetical protein